VVVAVVIVAHGAGLVLLGSKVDLVVVVVVSIPGDVLVVVVQLLNPTY
jgi:hypothetical protein